MNNTQWGKVIKQSNKQPTFISKDLQNLVEKQQLTQKLQNQNVFQRIRSFYPDSDSKFFGDLLDAGQIQYFQKGQMVVSEGKNLEQIFIVLDGSYLGFRKLDSNEKSSFTQLREQIRSLKQSIITRTKNKNFFSKAKENTQIFSFSYSSDPLNEKYIANELKQITQKKLEMFEYKRNNCFNFIKNDLQVQAHQHKQYFFQDYFNQIVPSIKLVQKYRKPNLMLKDYDASYFYTESIFCESEQGRVLIVNKEVFKNLLSFLNPHLDFINKAQLKFFERKKIPNQQLLGLSKQYSFINNFTNDLIFQMNDPIDRFLIILEGSVSLNISEGDSIYQLQTLITGDYFGYQGYHTEQQTQSFHAIQESEELRLYAIEIKRIEKIFKIEEIELIKEISAERCANLIKIEQKPNLQRNLKSLIDSNLAIIQMQFNLKLLNKNQQQIMPAQQGSSPQNQIIQNSDQFQEVQPIQFNLLPLKLHISDGKKGVDSPQNSALQFLQTQESPTSNLKIRHHSRLSSFQNQESTPTSLGKQADFISKPSLDLSQWMEEKNKIIIEENLESQRSSLINLQIQSLQNSNNINGIEFGNNSPFKNRNSINQNNLQTSEESFRINQITQVDLPFGGGTRRRYVLNCNSAEFLFYPQREVNGNSFLGYEEFNSNLNLNASNFPDSDLKNPQNKNKNLTSPNSYSSLNQNKFKDLYPISNRISTSPTFKNQGSSDQQLMGLKGVTVVPSPVKNQDIYQIEEILDNHSILKHRKEIKNILQNNENKERNYHTINKSMESLQSSINHRIANIQNKYQQFKKQKRGNQNSVSPPQSQIEEKNHSFVTSNKIYSMGQEHKSTIVLPNLNSIYFLPGFLQGNNQQNMIAAQINRNISKM